MLKSSKKTATESSSNEMNHISKGTKITGDVVCGGTFRLEGELEGNMVSESRVILAETSVLKGTLKAQNAEVSGKVYGTVEITDELVLKKTAVIEADMVIGKLNIESGAQYNGDIRMGTSSKGAGFKPSDVKGK